MSGAAASAPPSVRYPGSAPDPRPGRSGETITNGWLILSGDGLIGAGESLEAARTNVRRRLDAVGVVLTWETVDQRRTYPCTDAAVAAAWQMLENHGFPRRLERLQLLTGEDCLIYTISQPCEACGGPDSPTGGPGGYCEACDSTGRVPTDVDAAPEHDVALPIGIGWDPEVDRGAVPGIDEALVRQPVWPPCPDCGGDIASAEAGYAPYARRCTSCGSLFRET